MNVPDFEGWVALYIQTTGCDADRVAEILLANRPIFVDRWHSSYEELCECTQRLVEGRRVPKFPNEHTNAIGVELVRLRDERRTRKQNQVSITPSGEIVRGCDCPRCMPPNGSEKYQDVWAQFQGFLTYLKRGDFFREVPK